MTNLERLQAGFKAAFIDRDFDAVDEYWAEDYIQHSTFAADGRDGLKQAIAQIGDGFSYTPARAIEDGDFVALHGIYTGFGPDPLVAFDLMRVVDGKNAEHWDALTPVVARTASGRSQTDGPTSIEDLDRTEENKERVREFVEKVLVGADYAALADYISTEQYDQHNPFVADGLDGLGRAVAAMAADGRALVYKKVHHIVGQGNFVLAVSEGEFGGPVAFWDLWRLKDGKLVEHWDVVQPIPEKLPHGNGVF
ncbi:nuclear transport factor 2 family protein [Sinomonas mesophila]|uniref:nuclear transport factor 2 family protein n=1 Tax=Sinomonas mesophila TaxID=1531955 RepID=UPI0009877082|nr:nuclear transport factor 2 family protein [Sinomonas mesophila]